MKGLSLAVIATLLAAVPAMAQPDYWTRQSDSFFSGQGELDDSDDAFEHDNRYYTHDVWPFSAEVGEQITISVESSDFDSMVVLLSVSENGTELEEINDDMNAQTTNSQIVVDIMRDSDFIIGVLPYNAGAQGAYTISLRSTSLLGSPEQHEDIERLTEQGAELNRALRDTYMYPLF